MEKPHKINKLTPKDNKTPLNIIKRGLENYIYELDDLNEAVKRQRDKTDKIIDRKNLLARVKYVYD